MVSLAVCASVARADAQSALSRGTAELSASIGVAHGVTVLQSTGGQEYLMPSIMWGRVLTDLRGPRWARGRFEWAVEVSPFIEWSSGRARGAGVAPLAWRWNLRPHGRVAPYADVGGGALWTSAAIPAGTTGSNFMAHAGGGIRILGASGEGLTLGYRFHHISNGNRLGRNPGVNAHMLSIGWTRVRP